MLTEVDKEIIRWFVKFQARVVVVLVIVRSFSGFLIFWKVNQLPGKQTKPKATARPHRKLLGK